MAGRIKHGSRPPWVGLGAAVWVQIAAGSAFTFPLYSHSLKSVLGFNQQQLTILGVANDIGENVGILPGVVCNRLPPWSILVIGGAAAFVGFGVMWLAISQTVTALPYWLLWFALCIGTNSSAWLGTAAIVTNMRNFPLSRGTVAGIMKGYVALSAAVYTEIYTGALKSSSSSFLLLLALGIPFVCLCVMYFVRPCIPSLEDDSTEHGHFRFVQIVSVVLGFYLLGSTIIDDVLTVSDAVSCLFFAIMILLLLSPLAIPLKMTLVKRKSSGVISQSNSSQSLGDQEKAEPLLTESSSTTNLGNFQDGDDSSDVDILLAEGEGAIKKRRPRRGEDFEFCEALVKADFWLLFVAYFIGVGSGVTVLNNLAQIGMSVGNDDTTILLCLFSISNFAGRLSGGVVSEHFVRSRMLPRSIWMAITQIVMVLTYLLFAYGPSTVLYVSIAVLGICYGVQFSVMIPTVSELFGLKHFGIFYNFMLMGNPLGALLFSGLLAGYVYDSEAAKQHPGGLTDDSSSSCFGPQCFRLTFLVLSGVCVFGTLLSIILTVRVKPVYQMLYSGGSFRLPRNSH